MERNKCPTCHGIGGIFYPKKQICPDCNGKRYLSLRDMDRYVKELMQPYSSGGFFGHKEYRDETRGSFENEGWGVKEFKKRLGYSLKDCK